MSNDAYNNNAANNDAWYRFYAPRRLAAQTAAGMAADCAVANQEVDALVACMALQPSDRILEIGCGWGRHSLAFAKRGFGCVKSIDIAPEPLAVARQMAQAAGVECDFRQQSFCTEDEPGYAAILSLYDRSCCGFPTEREDAASLARLATLLLPGGWLIFGINDWPFALPHAAKTWHVHADGLELEEVIPDRVEMTCTHRVTWHGHDCVQATYTLTRRHYYLPEVRRLLADAGLELVAARHRLLDTRAYGDGSDGLFVFARKRV